MECAPRAGIGDVSGCGDVSRIAVRGDSHVGGVDQHMKEKQYLNRNLMSSGLKFYL